MEYCLGLIKGDLNGEVTLITSEVTVNLRLHCMHYCETIEPFDINMSRVIVYGDGQEIQEFGFAA